MDSRRARGARLDLFGVRRRYRDGDRVAHGSRPGRGAGHRGRRAGRAPDHRHTAATSIEWRVQLSPGVGQRGGSGSCPRRPGSTSTTAPKELLIGLFASLGASRDAESYADRIIGWRTPPAERQNDETAAYRTAGMHYAPRGGVFPHVGELWLVMGLPEAVIERALPHLTVYSGQAQVSILDASAQVLGALPGMSPERLHDRACRTRGGAAECAVPLVDAGAGADSCDGGAGKGVSRYGASRLGQRPPHAFGGRHSRARGGQRALSRPVLDDDVDEPERRRRGRRAGRAGAR